MLQEISGTENITRAFEELSRATECEMMSEWIDHIKRHQYTVTLDISACTVAIKVNNYQGDIYYDFAKANAKNNERFGEIFQYKSDKDESSQALFFMVIPSLVCPREEAAKVLVGNRLEN